MTPASYVDLATSLLSILGDLVWVIAAIVGIATGVRGARWFGVAALLALLAQLGWLAFRVLMMTSPAWLVTIRPGWSSW
jgi:hypothetical protein